MDKHDKNNLTSMNTFEGYDNDNNPVFSSKPLTD